MLWCCDFLQSNPNLCFLLFFVFLFQIFALERVQKGLEKRHFWEEKNNFNFNEIRYKFQLFHFLLECSFVFVLCETMSFAKRCNMFFTLLLSERCKKMKIWGDWKFKYLHKCENAIGKKNWKLYENWDWKILVRKGNWFMVDCVVWWVLKPWLNCINHRG